MKFGFQVFVFVSLGAALAITLPEHNCTEFFTYGVEDGNTFVGLFTAPKAGLQSISWHIKLTWLGSDDSPVHTIDHYPSEEQAVQNINNGLWAQLVVRFRNTSLEMPKLTLLEVNNMTLCSNPKCLCLSSAQALLVPQHNCDNHFRYATEDGGRTFIGIFTAPKLNIHNFKWQAIFEVRGSRSL
ncbi:uncharacterized protein LOC108139105 isoform X2 [Drosophila elegans]|nr:uncharacterized protein LOC108139105 isoform X2 [Drosophila elegans]